MAADSTQHEEHSPKDAFQVLWNCGDGAVSLVADWNGIWPQLAGHKSIQQPCGWGSPEGQQKWTLASVVQSLYKTQNYGNAGPNRQQKHTHIVSCGVAALTTSRWIWVSCTHWMIARRGGLVLQAKSQVEIRLCGRTCDEMQSLTNDVNPNSIDELVHATCQLKCFVLICKLTCLPTCSTLAWLGMGKGIRWKCWRGNSALSPRPGQAAERAWCIPKPGKGWG